MGVNKSEKSPWRRWMGEIALLFVALFLLHAWQTRNLPEGEAPKLEGYMLNGERRKLEDYAGKPVLVHFWATWCPICRREESSIDSLAEDYQVLTVATGSGSVDEVRAYMLEHEIDFPVLMDESGKIGAAWGVNGVPSSFFIDADGKIRYVSIGYTTELGMLIRMWLAAL